MSKSFNQIKESKKKELKIGSVTFSPESEEIKRKLLYEVFDLLLASNKISENKNSKK